MGISVDGEGRVSVSGGILPTIKIGLGPIGLKIGIEKTLELTKSKPYYLFVVWEDENGEVQREEYEIGKKFRVQFSQLDIIKEIRGENDSVIVVIERMVNTSEPILVESSVEQSSDESDTTSDTPSEFTQLSPEEFIRLYYEEINNRNYQLTWSMLSDNFKQRKHCCKPDGSFDNGPYIDWWNSIRQVETLSVTTQEWNDNSAVVEITLRYYKMDGDVVDSTSVFHLIAIPFDFGWQIN